MSLVMENLLEEIYKDSETPYWGDKIPVLVVRDLIDKAEEVTYIQVLDILSDLIDGYSKLGWTVEATAINLAYQRIQEIALIKGEK